MRHTVVRYTVHPGRAEENAELVRAVYAELAELRPDAFRYATYRLEDGDTFVHVAEGEGVVLTRLASFRAFQAGLRERCAVPPAVTPAQRVGAYAPRTTPASS